jgi:hypothetical protein
MLPTEGAILVQFQTVRVILLVLDGVVVALLALVAAQGDFHPVASFCHISAPPYYLTGKTKKLKPALFAVSSPKGPIRPWFGVEPALIASLCPR